MYTYDSFQMGIVKKKLLTRASASENYGGPPCDLSEIDLPTYRQVIQYYYYLQNLHENDNTNDFTLKIVRDILNIWKKVNDKLPLILAYSIENKVKSLLLLINDIKNKKGKLAVKKKNLNEKMDRLFDLSACKCFLNSVDCK